MEHVPPKCIFPSASDIPEKDLRVNLITVPSCDLHNSAKSLDDEFLMVSLAGIIGNNSVGYRYKFGKVERALRRRSHKLLDQVLSKKQIIHRIELKDNSFLDVLWGTPDLERLARCFEHIAYGLHLHHLKRKFFGQVKFHLGYLHYSEGNPKTWNEFLIARAEIDIKDKEKIGANPEAFYFQISDTDQFGLYIMKMCFYGGVNVYAAFIPEGAKFPKNPAMQFLEAGIKTVITLGDKEYHFEP